jgi:hypothetical protein
MADLKTYGKNAAVGGAAGSVFGPYGAAIGAGGGIVMTALGDLFDGGGQSVDDAERAKIAEMRKGAAVYSAYRPEVQQAREQALRQQLTAFNGSNNAMNMMYGGQYDSRNYAPTLGNNPYAPGHGPMTFAPTPPPADDGKAKAEAQMATFNVAAADARNGNPFGMPGVTDSIDQYWAQHPVNPNQPQEVSTLNRVDPPPFMPRPPNERIFPEAEGDVAKKAGG